VIFAASFQDHYVPYESARAEYAEGLNKDSKRGHIFKRMVQNILGRLKRPQVVRLDLGLKLAKSITNVIGRSAHIKVLDSLELQTLVAYVFADFLD
jgi:hypothetical protein